MVKTEIADGKIKVRADYSTQFIDRAKKMGGKWSYNNCSWDFDLEDEKEVRQLLMNIYCEDGATEVERVNVVVNLDCKELNEFCSEHSFLLLGNLDIIDRKGRNSDVILGTSVITIRGEFYSNGGSRSNPRIGCTDGISLKIKNMPLEWALGLLKQYGSEWITVERKEIELKKLENTKKLLEKLEKHLGKIVDDDGEKVVTLTKNELMLLVNKLK